MDIHNFISSNNLPTIDVRSEEEFAHGHIPGAINVPILKNEERKQVGICFKSYGQDAAIKLGYSLVQDQFDEKVQNVKNAISSNEAIIYCWRGGLRSKIFAEVLEAGGLNIERISKGYKAYRNWALQKLELTYPLIVLGGATGVGKTELLLDLKNKGEQIIDLEGLANHKGSAFGGIGMPLQPTNEQFENELAFRLNQFDKNKSIWIENESAHLGRVKVPDYLKKQMSLANVIEIKMPLDIRVRRIKKEYASLPKEDLIKATRNLEKRLGNLNMNKAIELINNNEHTKWIELLLVYYDKQYAYGNSLRVQSNIYSIEINEDVSPGTTEQILKHYERNIKGVKRSKANPI